jgi:hypothetical protein
MSTSTTGRRLRIEVLAMPGAGSRLRHRRAPQQTPEPVEDTRMSTLAPEATIPAVEPDSTAGVERPGRGVDLVALVVYLLGGVFLLAGLWRDLGHRVQASNVQDQGFFEFVLAHAARSVTHLENPLFTGQINVPDGVNMMANTSILALGIPLAPVTLIFGVGVSYALLGGLAPALTATAWYWVLSRHVVASRFAAFVAAGFCGFAPGIVSQSNAHPNVAAQFMVPLILSQVARLRSTERPVRTGVLLGLLIVCQAFINEEILLFTAIAGVVMALVYALSRWSELRRALRRGITGLAVAAGVGVALLAYPLWFQFFGPQHYGAVPGLSVVLYSDVGSYLNYATESLAGAPSSTDGLVAHLAEENAYYGWPLLIVALVIAVWLWRSIPVRIASAVAVFFGAMSLGPKIYVYGHDTGIPGPFRLVNWLPVIESVVPVRLALPVIAAVGLLIAVGLDRVVRAPRSAEPPKLIWYAMFAAALLPLFPTPLPAKVVPGTPAFITDGTWRRYVPAGRSVVTVPLPTFEHLEGQRWSARTDLEMPIAGGYFLGPGGGAGTRALYGSPSRPTSTLLDRVARTGAPPAVTDTDRRDAVEDLRFWRASVVVLGDVPNRNALRATVRALLGQEPRLVGGVWVWDVRSLVDG